MFGPKNASERRYVRVVEYVSVAKLVERDGLECHLCGELIDLMVPTFRHEGVSIDHLVPVKDGGETSMANCRLAHRLCNMRRGSRPLVHLESH